MANLFIAVAMTAAIAAVVIFVFSQKPKKARYRLPPGPPGLPIIGNLHQIINTVNLHRFLYNLSKIYGPILSYKLGCRRVVVISSPELAKEVLKTQDSNFSNRPDHRSHAFLTYGRRDIALNHYTPYYLEMKKMIISHLFSQTRVTGFQNVRGQEVQRLIDKVSEAADKSQVVDLSELLLTYANSVVCRQAFGKRYNEYGDEMKRFIKILNETQVLWGIVFYSDIFPYFKFLDHVTGLSARMKEAFKMNDSYLQELIDETRDPSRVKPETKSMIDLLMEIHRDQPFSSEFTLENIKAIILDIMVAGTDTAAGTIEWGMTYLMKYPEVMKKAQTEIRKSVEKTDFVTVEDIKNLPYFKALVKETLRIEPTIPLLAPRSCIKDTKIADYNIPAGTTINVNAWAISRDERSWGENPDQFRPERFIDQDVDFKGTYFELIPFGSGRRMCPAIRLAIAMIELPFANLLYKFDFELPTSMKAEDINMDVTAGVAVHRAEHLMLVPKKAV